MIIQSLLLDFTEFNFYFSLMCIFKPWIHYPKSPIIQWAHSESFLPSWKIVLPARFAEFCSTLFFADGEPDNSSFGVNQMLSFIKTL